MTEHSLGAQIEEFTDDQRLLALISSADMDITDVTVASAPKPGVSMDEHELWHKKLRFTHRGSSTQLELDDESCSRIPAPTPAAVS